MKVKCINNTGAVLPDILFTLYGYSHNMIFKWITIDRTYIVYAVFIMKRVKWYLICSDDYNGANINYPSFYPSSLFEIIDEKSSTYWVTKRMKDDYDDKQGLVLNTGFPQIINEEFFYGNLVEGHEREIIIFHKFKSLIDNEYHD
jgi:hypothetical protein